MGVGVAWALVTVRLPSALEPITSASKLISYYHSLTCYWCILCGHGFGGGGGGQASKLSSKWNEG